MGLDEITNGPIIFLMLVYPDRSVNAPVKRNQNAGNDIFSVKKCSRGEPPDPCWIALYIYLKCVLHPCQSIHYLHFTLNIINSKAPMDIDLYYPFIIPSSFLTL